MKWIGAHVIDRDVRFNPVNLYLPGGIQDAGSDTDKFLVYGGQGLLGYRTGAEVLSDIGGLPTSTNILAFDGSTANGVCTYKDADEISVESTLTYDSETLTIGADDDGISFIRRLAHSDGNGGILQLTAGNATHGQTNQAGGDLRLGGGQSTGSGAGGSVTLFTSPAGGSGPSINGYTNSWVFGADGSFTTEGGITTGSTSFVNASGVIQVATQGTIDHDSLANFVAAEHVDWAGAGAGTIHSSNITSLGTLTALDVDDINLNGKTITITGDTDDTFSIVAGANGATTLTTVDTAGDLGHFEIAADGNITLDALGDIALEAAGNDITMDADTLTIESSSLLSPFVTLKSTSSNAFASYFAFSKLRADDSPADNDTIGSILFGGEDAAGAAEQYGSIVGSIVEADHGDEAGKIQILVANDGTERNGITMSGDKGTASEVDVTIANGAASVTTIAGTLTMGSTAALTNAGLVAVANQSNITGVGTISSGVWEGTAIASANLDADTAHLTTDQTFTGIKQIDRRKFPISSGTDGNAIGDVVYFGGTTSMTVGRIYHYKSDGTWEIADADTVATCDGLLGVALGAASDTNGVLLRGMVTLDHDPGAVGDVLFLSTVAGLATSTAPSGNNDIVRVIGYCLHASAGNIWFNPDNTFVEVTA